MEVEKYQNLIATLAKEQPQVIRLAESLCLTARVEPELLRAARLALRPCVDAYVEADLWFSELIETRTTDWLVFQPQAAQVLAQRIKDRALADQFRLLILRAHQNAPETIRLEEDILWCAYCEDEGDSHHIEQSFRGVIGRFQDDPIHNVGYLRWFAGACRRFPVSVRKTPAFNRLSLVSSINLGGQFISEINLSGDETLDDFIDVLPENYPTLPVFIKYGSRSLEVQMVQGRGFKPVEVPRTDPVILIVCTDHHKDIIVSIRRNAKKSQRVPIAIGLIKLVSISGRVYELTPKVEMIKLPELAQDQPQKTRKIALSESLKSRANFQTSKEVSIIFSQNLMEAFQTVDRVY